MQKECLVCIESIKQIIGCENVALNEDKGVIKVSGRYRLNPLMPRKITEPVWIPKEHPITKKWLTHVHTHDLLHIVGEKRLLAASREYGWLHHGWFICRDVVTQCQHCKRRTHHPSLPPQAPIHKNRSPIDTEGPSRPFDKIGMDMFGPFLLKGRQ